MWLYKRALNYVREWGNKINMKRLVFVLGLCVCMAYGDEYNKQKAEFMSKNFERKLKELVKESGLKSESAKLLYQAAIVPALYESGLNGNDANGGWSIYTISLNYKGSNGRYYFWNQYERLAQRVSEVCGANIGSEANGINESYTPAQQKCIKSLATLELEMNKDIFKWNLEQMKNKEDNLANLENNGWDKGCDVDYTSIYQLTDTLWSNFQKEAKLGAFKDFNKPGMEQFYKGLFYLWITNASRSYWKGLAFGSNWGSNKFKSISDFFESRDEELERNFSFLYDSVEVNQKKLQARLDAVPKDARQADECYKTYLSTKEYQEARAVGIQKNARAKELGYRMSRAGALEKDMFEKLARYVRDNAASYLTFDKCIGLSDKDKDDENEDTQDSKESLFSGRYAELFDEKYYEKKSDDWYDPKVKPEIYENALYKELTWCAIKDKYNDVSNENSYKRLYAGSYVEDAEKNATAGRIVAVAEELFARKWQAMVEKYPYVDYESAIENPWYKDKAKRKSFDDDVNKNITSILENYKTEHYDCIFKIHIFKNGLEKCRQKLREKTLKNLQAKLK